MFLRLSNDKRATVILTTRPYAGTLNPNSVPPPLMCEYIMRKSDDILVPGVVFSFIFLISSKITDFYK